KQVINFSSASYHSLVGWFCIFGVEQFLGYFKNLHWGGCHSNRGVECILMVFFLSEWIDGISAKYYICPIRPGTPNINNGFTSHNNSCLRGFGFEISKIIWQMPWKGFDLLIF